MILRGAVRGIVHRRATINRIWRAELTLRHVRRKVAGANLDTIRGHNLGLNRVTYGLFAAGAGME
jgi:hypothetical protein